MREPTKTVTIRKAWLADFTRRYKQLAAEVRAFFKRVQELQNFNQRPDDFVFLSDPKKILFFQRWLEAEIERIIFDGVRDPDLLWQNKYILDAYTKGVQLAISELKNITDEIPEDFEGLLAIQQAFALPTLGTAKSEVLTRPVHTAAIETIYVRDFTQLKGINAEMSNQMSRILADGLAAGENFNVIAEGLVDRVNKIGLTRAKLLARTESVRAYNLGHVIDVDDRVKNLGVEPKYKWNTSMDERVRSTHAKRNGHIYTTKELLPLIGEPNCRCGQTLTADFLIDEVTKQRDKQRRELGLSLINQ